MQAVVNKSFDSVPLSNDRIISNKEMSQLVSRSYKTLWRWHTLGHFPKPIFIGSRSIGWRQSDYNSWLLQKAA